MSNEKSTASSQADRFRKAARELGADESEEAFDKALKRIATAPPPKSDNGKVTDKETSSPIRQKRPKRR